MTESDRSIRIPRSEPETFTPPERLLAELTVGAIEALPPKWQDLLMDKVRTVRRFPESYGAVIAACHAYRILIKFLEAMEALRKKIDSRPLHATSRHCADRERPRDQRPDQGHKK